MKRSLRTLATLTSAIALGGPQFLFPSSPTTAQTLDTLNECPIGTTRATQNLIVNGNFAVSPGVIGAIPPGNPASFTSIMPYRGDAVYPDDPVGGLSIQTGAVTYFGGGVNGVPFPGDPARGIAASNTYLYSNPNQTPAGGTVFNDPIVWTQTVTVRPNTTYNFIGYFLNLLTPGLGADPDIRLIVGPSNVESRRIVPALPFTSTPAERWGVANPIQISFTTGPAQTTVVLSIVDSANTVVGDDFGFTAVGLRECIPTLGISKQAGTPLSNGDGTFTIPYTVRVRNFAPAGTPLRYDLLNLQLSDDLTRTFVSAASFRVQPGSIQSPTLNVNPNFVGIPSTANPRGNDLLLGTDTLPANTTAIVTFNVIVTPGTGPDGFGVFNNQVTATATSRGGSPVQSQSTNGATPDRDNNGLPDPPSFTPVRLPRGGTGGVPSFRLVKRITGVTRNGAPLPGVNFGSFVDDPGSNDDNSPGWAQFPPVGQIALDVNNPLRSGDEVVYTVYYLSDGTSAATAANICDPIPAGTAFVPNSSLVQQAGGAAFAGGAFFPSLVPLPPANSCASQTNANGTILFDVGDVPNTAGNNFGFVRFRVRIN